MTHAILSTEQLPEADAAASVSTDAAEPAATLVSDASVEAEPGSGSEQDSEAEQDAEAVDGSDLQMAGGTLNDEELAAVTAVLGTLAGASEVEHNGAGSAGPSDRTLQRRRRLGLWGRPGPDSWKHAAGLR
ncbi:hypothetical protein LTH96_08650 [Nesterenkonia sp. LB17]|uniref:acyl-CoA carboxylase epsilon subunit n=1 Tax=unclassified Nesterenkonia TaxID=2629769 RepID=UPI001F4D32BB|nr:MULTISPECIES: acyl-CoA carboxylase epsilon subunit [unclassified Nesterenkonia]MCH8560468.1 hypothetical protein [Nesterenkonia sp. DZ6]MCH8562735.1 hypothetical protein [Nesterenkonia sp. YGD6]MCH8565784.1 hypothetical protein [Nesterenkonia sp. LB17]